MQHCPVGFIFQRHEQRHPHKRPAFAAKSWTKSGFCTIACKIGLMQQLSIVSVGVGIISNFIHWTFCAHALLTKVWRQMEALFQAWCVNSTAVPSLMKCCCPDYPAVRHRSKWVSSSGRGQGRGGGWVWGASEWDAHWPGRHHKPPV